MEDNKYRRFISESYRFGCGYRMESGRKQYYVFHGYPRGNDDYFITAEISEEEYEQINKEYPDKIAAGLETATLFKKKYIEEHLVLLEGWNDLL